MAQSLPSSMRAAQWTTNVGGIERNIHVKNDAPLPKAAAPLAPDSTLVKVEYASLNPIDYKLAENPVFGSLLITKPATPCLDYAGTVVQTTRSTVKVGDKVFGKSDPPMFGALAEYAVIGKKGGCVVIPAGVKLEDAATIGTAGLIAYQCLVPFVKPGDKVLINGGSGGVGTYAIQIAKLIGANVTAICSSANVELSKSLGVDEVIDYRTRNVIEYLKRSGRQYNHILDTVFADSNLYWQAEHYLQPEGIFITIGAKPDFATIRTFLLINFLPAFLGGKKRKFQYIAVAANTEQYEQIASWIKEGKVKTVIEQVFKLDEAGEAFARLKSGRTRGKLVVKI